jgi:cytochrome o ubiquinol oxidase subunit IV
MNVISRIENGNARGSLRYYVTGLVLALVLTVVAFWTVMSGAAPDTAVAAIFAFALLQVVVHLVFFLHMNASSDQQWNLLAFVFAVLIVGILVGGSIWILYHLNHNMMAMPMG